MPGQRHLSFIAGEALEIEQQNSSHLFPSADAGETFEMVVSESFAASA
ncbi:MAG: hypothetical protein MZW92_68040 [Comamonadaceae bacterium]|nr:hypothetical protein [Comamonadaceae bacterium]